MKMYFKLCLLAVCVLGVSCVSYEDALTKCKADHKVTKDEPLDYFMANGKFQPGDEHMKGLFNCLGVMTGIVDEKGVPVADKLTALAKTSKAADLQLFADENVMKACLPPPDVSSPDDATFSYVKCALQQKAAAEKAKSK